MMAHVYMLMMVLIVMVMSMFKLVMEVFGGIVFYVDETGEYEVSVASFDDLGELYWGCIGVYVTTENQIGYGFKIH